MATPPLRQAKPGPRLYLITPVIEDTADFVRELPLVLDSAGLAAVLLRLKLAGESDLARRAKAVAAAVQPRDVALVLDGHPDIAARAGADGSHLSGITAFTAAVDSLKPARIAGCGGLKTRHDAMAAAERGADYVLFGEPEASGWRPSFAAIVERIEWWAELFEIPCVGFAGGPDEIEALAAAGADFIACDFIWTDPRGPAAALAEAAQQIPSPIGVA
jgi:thiamine-phosphate pyrophosphorylase